ncbi:MAG: hypothetical protein IKT58_01390 [Oscillospiraceae bacterium]|nr:hypothetical protein [Oscillospiraceae bacterium]
MKMKKVISLLLCVGLLLSLAACRKKKEAEKMVVVDPSTYSTFAAIETAPQKEYTPEQILSIYNIAVQKLIDSKSYTMKGNWSSTSDYAGEVSTVVSEVDVSYANGSEGPVAFFDVNMNREGQDLPHTTYYKDGRYYFYAYDWKYFTESNDYTDYYAHQFLMPIDDVELIELEHMDQMDGSLEVSFTIPMGQYKSEGILAILGEFCSPTVEEDLLRICFTIDKDGTMTYFYMNFESEMELLGELVRQEIVLSMSLSDYDTAVVNAPADLDLYEDNVYVEVEPEGGPVGELSPEDVN